MNDYFEKKINQFDSFLFIYDNASFFKDFFFAENKGIFKNFIIKLRLFFVVRLITSLFWKRSIGIKKSFDFRFFDRFLHFGMNEMCLFFFRQICTHLFQNVCVWQVHCDHTNKKNNGQKFTKLYNNEHINGNFLTKLHSVFVVLEDISLYTWTLKTFFFSNKSYLLN